MKTELSPLQALENLKNLSHDVQYASKIPCIDNELEVIETALKELENIDRVGKMFCIDVDKKLKALEIIKEFSTLENDTIIIHIPNHKLTENGVRLDRENMKKFDLLKEVLL